MLNLLPRTLLSLALLTRRSALFALPLKSEFAAGSAFRLAGGTSTVGQADFNGARGRRVLRLASLLGTGEEAVSE